MALLHDYFVVSYSRLKVVILSSNLTFGSYFDCRYFDPLPKFFFIDDLQGTICRIVLPPNAPVRQVDGMPYSSKDEAKRASCLKACMELHKKGALTDFLLPDLNKRKRKELVTDYPDCDISDRKCLGNCC